jgi:hypothetical protein
MFVAKCHELHINATSIFEVIYRVIIKINEKEGREQRTKTLLFFNYKLNDVLKVLNFLTTISRKENFRYNNS